MGDALLLVNTQIPDRLLPVHLQSMDLHPEPRAKSGAMKGLEQLILGSSDRICVVRRTLGCRSVVQFAYGEDGLDVTKKSFMKEFGFLARNAERFAQQVDLAGAKRSSDISGLSPLEAAAQKRNRCFPSPI